MIKLLGSRVAIIPVPDPSYTGTLWIPDQGKQRIDQGVVKYKGPKVTTLIIGDHVIFSGYTGTKVTLKDEGILFIMNEEDVELIVGDGDILFTQDQIISLLHEAEGQAIVRCEGQMKKVEGITVLREYMESQIKDYISSKGLEF